MRCERGGGGWVGVWEEKVPEEEKGQAFCDRRESGNLVTRGQLPKEEETELNRRNAKVEKKQGERIRTFRGGTAPKGGDTQI